MVKQKKDKNIHLIIFVHWNNFSNIKFLWNKITYFSQKKFVKAFDNNTNVLDVLIYYSESIFVDICITRLWNSLSKFDVTSYFEPKR